MRYINLLLLASLSMNAIVGYVTYKDHTRVNRLDYKMKHEVGDINATRLGGATIAQRLVETSGQAHTANVSLRQFNLYNVRYLSSDRVADLLRIELDKDMDGDGFKNADDPCIDSPGVANGGYYGGQDGCPESTETMPSNDADGDSVSNYRDFCPNEVGADLRVRDYGMMIGTKVRFPPDQGCSNRDEDNVIDRDDLCPNTASEKTADKWGCTDSEEDKKLILQIYSTCTETGTSVQDGTDGGGQLKSGFADYLHCTAGPYTDLMVNCQFDETEKITACRLTDTPMKAPQVAPPAPG